MVLLALWAPGGAPSWAVTVVAATLASILERRSRVGRALGGALIAFVVRSVVANVLPSMITRTDVADAVLVDSLLPVALSLIVVAAQAVPREKSAGARASPAMYFRVLLAFVLGAASSLLGGVVSFLTAGHLDIPADEAARAAGCIAATYIGGSVNFVATARAVGLSASMFGALVAADIGLMGLYFAGLLLAHQSSFLRRAFPETGLGPGRPHEKSQDNLRLPPKPDVLLPSSLSFLSAACVSACAVSAALLASRLLERRLGNAPGAGTLAVTSCSWIVGLAVQRGYLGPAGAVEMCCRQAGAFFMLVFFAAIGAQARASELFGHGAALAAFAAVCLAVHAAVLLASVPLANLCLRAFGKRLGVISLDEVLVASNANVGGAATAAAFAGAALKRPDLVIPATCCGIVGYGVATTSGVALASLLSSY